MTEREVVTLKEHFETRFAAQEYALRLAREALEHRLEGMNEFRAQLEKQTTSFVTKGELGAWREHVDEDLRGLRESRSQLAGKASATQAGAALLFGLIGTLIGAAGLIVAIMK